MIFSSIVEFSSSRDAAMPTRNNRLQTFLFPTVFLFLLFVVPTQTIAETPGRPAPARSSLRSPPPERAQDVYFQTEGIVLGEPAPKTRPTDYTSFIALSGMGGNRVVVWALAQQHLYFGGLVFGVLFWVTLLELMGALSKKRDAARQYDRLAYEMLRLTMLAFSFTAILGGIFLFALLALYPTVMKYLAGVFQPFFLVYGLLFLGLTAAASLYYATWRRAVAGLSKRLHIGLGLIANLIGTAILLLTNSWISFMTSPSGVDAQGRFLGNYWNVLRNPLWIPTSVHRFFVHLLFGAIVIAVYAAYHALISRDPKERTQYDRMGFITLFLGMLGFFTLPFGGYWLVRETYGYRQQMGITQLGGLLAWLGVLLVILVGALFIGINYYLWQRIDLAPGASRYRPQFKYILLILTICLITYATPHTLVMTPLELKLMGGAQHPVVGNWGVESAKQPAVNIMIVCTLWSLLLFWKSLYRRRENFIHSLSETALAAVFAAGVANLIGVGIYGYFIPANVRIGLSVPMVMTTLSIALFGSLLTAASLSGAKRTDAPVWGGLSVRGYYALFFIAVTVTWVMGLGGYRRSALRLHWHVNEILRDSSPWAFTPPVGFVGMVLTVNTLLFWGAVCLIFWLAKSKTAHPIQERTRTLLPEGTPEVNR